MHCKEEIRLVFEVPEYDANQTLILDPTLAYSFVFGGSGNDRGAAIAVDSAGNAYVTGSTFSKDFPTTNPAQPTFGGGDQDAFVVKLNAAGNALVYATYLGGSNSDGGNGIALDAAGNAYITGATFSKNFPTANPFQATNPSLIITTFVAKLNATGNALIYSTYLGGKSGSIQPAYGIAVDASGSAYVTGSTDATDFPTKNPFQAAVGGRFARNAFITKLDPSGSALVYSSFLGGGGPDQGLGISVDASGNVYVAGSTQSKNFPRVNAFQSALRGNVDAFVAKVNPSGSALVYSSYLGGDGDGPEFASGIAVDSSGNAFISGVTGSANFPTAAGAFQFTTGGQNDAFVTKISASGAIAYSSYLGGSGPDGAAAVAVDSSGRAYLTGVTGSTNFPQVSPLQPAYGGGQSDAFVAVVNAAGTALEFSSYIGGSGSEIAAGIAVDGSGNAYVAGATSSTDFPKPKADQAGATKSDSPNLSNQTQPKDNTLLFKIKPLITVPPPTEFFDESNCIKIIRTKENIEIDGRVWRFIGASKGYKTDRAEKFVRINEALNFVGKDIDADRRDLSVRSKDIFQLGPCRFNEHVVVPDRNERTGPLASITIRGSGQASTVILSDEDTVTIFSAGDETNPNAVEDLKLFPKQFGIYTFTRTRVARVSVEGAEKTGFYFNAGGEVTDCNIEICKEGIGAFSNSLKLEKVTLEHFDRGIYTTNTKVTASKFTFTPHQNAVVMEFSGSEGSRVDQAKSLAPVLGVRFVKLDGVKNTIFSNVTGGAVVVRGSSGITIRGGDLSGVSAQTDITGIDIRNSDNIVISNMHKITGFVPGVDIEDSRGIVLLSNSVLGNGLAGVIIRNSKGVVLKDNVIAYNPIGVSKDSLSDVTLDGNTIALNKSPWRDKEQNVLGKDSFLGISQDNRTFPFGASSPSIFQNNTFFANSESGIRLETDGNVDLGGGSGGSKGGNILTGNANFDLINNAGIKISAKNNIWSSTDPNEILGKYVSPGAGVDVAPVMPLQAIYFAQFAEAPGFTSVLTLTNPSRTNGAATLIAFRNSAGAGVNVKLNGNDSPGGLQPGVVAPLGARSFTTDSATTAVTVGSILAASGRPLAGTVLFSSPAGVDGVGRSELLTQFIAPVERSASRKVNTGIAITNPSTTAAISVALRLSDSSAGAAKEGGEFFSGGPKLIREATVQLPAGGQAAKFIDELFSDVPGEFAGTLSAVAATQMGATVIRTSPGQFATLPVTGTGSKRLLFAQFGEVSGISSTLTFVNPSLDRTGNVTVKLFDDNGAPLTVNLNGSDRPGQFSFSIPPQSSVRFASPGTSTTAKIGSVVVESTENIGGTILFGGSFGLAGVGASQQLSNFVAPVEQSTQGGVITGLALMNAGTSQITVRLTLREESGTPLDGGTVDVVLAAQGHVAKFISQFFPGLSLADFRGTISGETSGQIGATVIRQSSAPQEFATLPVAEIIP